MLKKFAFSEIPEKRSDFCYFFCLQIKNAKINILEFQSFLGKLQNWKWTGQIKLTCEFPEQILHFSNFLQISIMTIFKKFEIEIEIQFCF